MNGVKSFHSQNDGINFFSIIPEDLVFNILSFLPVLEVVQCTRLSKDIRIILNKNILWKKFYITYFGNKKQSTSNEEWQSEFKTEYQWYLAPRFLLKKGVRVSFFINSKPTYISQTYNGAVWEVKIESALFSNSTLRLENKLNKLFIDSTSLDIFFMHHQEKNNVVIYNKDLILESELTHEPYPIHASKFNNWTLTVSEKSIIYWENGAKAREFLLSSLLPEGAELAEIHMIKNFEDRLLILFNNFFTLSFSKKTQSTLFFKKFHENYYFHSFGPEEFLTLCLTECKLYLWSLEGTLLHSFADLQGSISYDVDFLHRKLIVGFMNGNIKVFNLDTGALIHEIHELVQPNSLQNLWIYDNRCVTQTVDGQLSLWNLTSATMINSFHKEEPHIKIIRLTIEKFYISALYEHQDLKVWEFF